MQCVRRTKCGTAAAFFCVRLYENAAASRSGGDAAAALMTGRQSKDIDTTSLQAAGGQERHATQLSGWSAAD